MPVNSSSLNPFDIGFSLLRGCFPSPTTSREVPHVQEQRSTPPESHQVFEYKSPSVVRLKTSCEALLLNSEEDGHKMHTLPFCALRKQGANWQLIYYCNSAFIWLMSLLSSLQRFITSPLSVFISHHAFFIHPTLLRSHRVLHYLFVHMKFTELPLSFLHLSTLEPPSVLLLINVSSTNQPKKKKKTNRFFNQRKI